MIPEVVEFFQATLLERDWVWLKLFFSKLFSNYLEINSGELLSLETHWKAVDGGLRLLGMFARTQNQIC